MIQVQLKLKLTKRQEMQMDCWLYHLTSVWNWAIRKIELDARDAIYYSHLTFKNLLARHSKKLGVPSHVLQGMLSTAHRSWDSFNKGVGGKPRFKGRRNKLNSIPFPDGARVLSSNGVRILGFRSIKFHKQDIPEGQINCARIVKRASGWYLCLFIKAEPRSVSPLANCFVGIDPGFESLLTLSDGEKIDHPRELEVGALRHAQAQRGNNKKLAARLRERETNRRKDRNHKLSRRLVSENQLIAFSADTHRAIAKRFGKSVTSSSHYQLRQMLDYKSKCRTDGLGVYVEVPSRNSTKTCSTCGALSGPSGLASLSVRLWTCVACGAEHDRDVNAAVNTLIAGVGLALEKLAIAA